VLEYKQWHIFRDGIDIFWQAANPSPLAGEDRVRSKKTAK
jgi:hypothetical protein